MNIKQVIVMIKKFPLEDGNFFHPRTGKMVAQGSHASSYLFSTFLYNISKATLFQRIIFSLKYIFKGKNALLDFNEVRWLKIDNFQLWAENGIKKIVLQVENEEQLLKIAETAMEKKLPVAIVEDHGLTEFKKPTITCISIGPDNSEMIDEVTKDLKLI